MAGKSGKFFRGLYFILNFSLFTTIVFLSCTPVHRIPKISGIKSLSFLGKYELPHGFMFNQTLVGGLSGIEYDPANDEIYLISDDRSAINPARFYKAGIEIGAEGINQIQLKSVTFLRNTKGAFFPSNKMDPSNSIDPESIRYDPIRKQVIWTSEGEKLKNSGGWVLQDPAIIRTTMQGNYEDSFHLPALVHMQPGEKGPRSNGTFEGLSFIDQFRALLVSLEEPLFEDGHRAGLGERRIIGEREETDMRYSSDTTPLWKRIWCHLAHQKNHQTVGPCYHSWYMTCDKCGYSWISED